MARHSPGATDPPPDSPEVGPEVSNLAGLPDRVAGQDCSPERGRNEAQLPRPEKEVELVSNTVDQLEAHDLVEQLFRLALDDFTREVGAIQRTEGPAVLPGTDEDLVAVLGDQERVREELPLAPRCRCDAGLQLSGIEDVEVSLAAFLGSARRRDGTGSLSGRMA